MVNGQHLMHAWSDICLGWQRQGGLDVSRLRRPLLQPREKPSPCPFGSTGRHVKGASTGLSFTRAVFTRG